MRLLAEEIFHQRLNTRHARLSANQHDLIDFAGINTRIFHRLLARTDRALDDVFNQLFQFGTGKLLHQVLRTRGVGRYKRQIDLALHCGGQLDLGFFRGVA